MKIAIFIASIIIVSAAVLIPACGTSAPPPVATPAAPSATIGQYAEAGQTVFANRCKGCHGDQGQGARAPAVIGVGANLGKYNTAKGLLEYISIAMPANAPGTLAQQDYAQVTSFLLVNNSYAQAGTAFDSGKLDGISLKK